MSTIIFRGKPACRCLAKWLPVYERELQDLELLVGELQIFQLNGTAEASAGTHTGGAFDIVDLPGTFDVMIAREMGAPATWLRGPAQGFIVHLHGILRGCPHNRGGAYQIDAVDDGFNGLGKGGRGGPDDGPQVTSRRTWEEGIAWAKARQAERVRKAKLARLRERRRKITRLIRKLMK